jgi:hypothetical protein
MVNAFDPAVDREIVKIADFGTLLFPVFTMAW